MNDLSQDKLIKVMAVKARLQLWPPVVIERWVRVCSKYPRRIPEWEMQIKNHSPWDLGYRE